MIAQAAERYGVSALGIGSIFRISRIQWWNGCAMAAGHAKQILGKAVPLIRLSRSADMVSGHKDFQIWQRVCTYGFSETETDAIMGGNWLRFYDENLSGRLR